MKLTNLPPYELGQVVLPLLSDVAITWLENGDVEIGNADDEQVDLVKQAIYTAAGVTYVPEAAYESVSTTKDWLTANPNAMLLVDLPVAELMAEIDGLDLTTLPTATRNKLRLLLKTLTMAVRVLIKRERLG